jgi:hypothetical protein
MLSRTIHTITLVVALAALSNAFAANNPLDPASQNTPQNPLSKTAEPKPASPWVGSYTSPWEVSLRHEDGADGLLRGEIVVSGKSFAVELRAAGKKFDGKILVESTSFPLTVEIGEESGQIVVQSGGNLYELERATDSKTRPAGPDARIVKCDPVQGANFKHPQGYFSLKLPQGCEREGSGRRPVHSRVSHAGSRDVSGGRSARP